MIRFLFTIPIFFFTLLAYPQKTIIDIHTNDSHKERIVFYEFTDKLINSRSEVFSLKPGEENYLSAEIDINEIKYLFTEYGACHYYFFAEPGMEYELNLPEFIPITQEQKNNPYYIPLPVHLKVILQNQESPENCLELNEAIRLFDEAFEPFYNEQILRYYSVAESQKKADSFFNAAIHHKPLCSVDFYKEYTKFKRGIIEFSVDQFDLNYLINEYFTSKKPCISNPAWWELFEKVYDKHFSFLSTRQNMEQLYSYILSSDYSSLDSLLKLRPDLHNDTLRGLLILRELHNSFNTEVYPQKTLVTLFDKIADNSSVPYIKQLAKAIRERNTRLLPGSPIPSFRLTDAFGKEYIPGDFHGKYIYLGFCRTNSLQCMREFEYLRYYEKKYNDYLDIITVFKNTTEEELKEMKEQYNYSWYLTKNSSNNDDVFTGFDVRGIPMFFLISPEGNLLISPAPLPSGDFERTFYRIMRNRGDI